MMTYAIDKFAHSPFNPMLNVNYE